VHGGVAGTVVSITVSSGRPRPGCLSGAVGRNGMVTLSPTNT